MYHKVKNTLVGLGAVAAIILGGALVSEPVPAKTADAGLSTETMHTEVAFAITQTAVSIAHAAVMAELAADATTTARTEKAPEPERKPETKSSSRLRLELGMPYYSFGAVLPRRRES